MKLSDNDFEIMNIIWDEGEVTALEMSHRLAEKKGWKKPTVYTLIDRLIKKGAVERSEPDYVCRALINKEDVRTSETAGLLERLYNGSAKLLVSGFIKEKQLSSEELEELRKLINESIDENDRGNDDVISCDHFCAFRHCGNSDKKAFRKQNGHKAVHNYVGGRVHKIRRSR